MTFISVETRFNLERFGKKVRTFKINYIWVFLTSSRSKSMWICESLTWHGISNWRNLRDVQSGRYSLPVQKTTKVKDTEKVKDNLV